MAKAIKYAPGAERMITIRGAAARYGLTPTRVKTLIVRGDLQARLINGQYLIRPSDVEQLLEDAIVAAAEA